MRFKIRAWLLILVAIVSVCGCATRGAKRTNLRHLSNQLAFFYLDPRPETVDHIIQESTKQEIFADADAVPPSWGFLAGAIRAHPGETRRWSATISRIRERDQVIWWQGVWLADTDSSRAVLAQRLADGTLPPASQRLGKDPPRLLELEVESATHLDILWGAFFGSGDVRYVDRIIAVLDWTEEELKARYEENPAAGAVSLAVRAAAQWALTSNCIQHSRVMRHCESELSSAEEPRFGHLNKIVSDAQEARQARRKS